MTNNPAELKPWAKGYNPCPLCGGEHILVKENDGFYFNVICIDCNLKLTTKDPKEVWNARPPTVKPTVEEIKSIVSNLPLTTWLQFLPLKKNEKLLKAVDHDIEIIAQAIVKFLEGKS